MVPGGDGGGSFISLDNLLRNVISYSDIFRLLLV